MFPACKMFACKGVRLYSRLFPLAFPSDYTIHYRKPYAKSFSLLNSKYNRAIASACAEDVQAHQLYHHFRDGYFPLHMYEDDFQAKAC